MMKKNIIIIVAMTPERVIGCQGKIPWHLPSDLKRFKKLTEFKVVVMGRKTYESLPEKFRPLPNRINVVLSRNKFQTDKKVLIFPSLEKVLSEVTDPPDNNFFIIGGAEIYRQALPLASKIHLTIVDADIEGDTFFPQINDNEWQEETEEKYQKGPKDEFGYWFKILRRKHPFQLNLLNLDHARVAEQRNKMSELIQKGICPFCPEYLVQYHDTSIIKKYQYWVLTYNDYLYDGAAEHLLVIAKEHWTDIGDITPEAAGELITICAEASRKHPGGALLMRFGNTDYTGATVSHLHTQLIFGGPKVAGPENQIITLVGYKKTP